MYSVHPYLILDAVTNGGTDTSHLAMKDGRPLIFMYQQNFYNNGPQIDPFWNKYAAHFDNGRMFSILSFLRTKVVGYFNNNPKMNPIIIVNQYFACDAGYAVPNSDFHCPNTGGTVPLYPGNTNGPDAVYSWYEASRGETTEPADTTNGAVSGAAVAPGFRKPFDSLGNFVGGYPPNCGTMCQENSRSDGQTLRNNLQSQQNTAFVLLEGWTDVVESAGYYRSLEGNDPNNCTQAGPPNRVDYPNQTLNIVRHFANPNGYAVDLPAQTADTYFDATGDIPGNNGGYANRYYRVSRPADNPTCQYSTLSVGFDPTGSGTYFVGWTDPTKWIQFQGVELPAGTYPLKFLYATPQHNAQICVWVDKAPNPGHPEQATTCILLPSTGGWLNWNTLVLGSVALTQGGPHTFGFSFPQDSINLANTRLDSSVPVPPSTPAYTYPLPLIANGANGYTTFLTAQNASSTAANLTIQYYDGNGQPSLATAQHVVLPAHAEYVNAPNPFSAGTAGTGIMQSDQPLSVVVSEKTPAGGSAYTVSRQAGSTLVAPLAINGQYGFTTQLTVFNSGPTQAMATVRFYDASGTNPSSTSLTLAPYTSQTLNQSSASGSGLPTNFYGWAQIAGSGGSQLAAQIVENGTGFVAIANAQTATSSTVYAPAVFNGAYSFYTGTNIINPNSASVTGAITYYDQNGNQVSTHGLTIPAFGLVSLYQGNDSLPQGYGGSATVTMTGNVVMVVNEQGPNTQGGTPESGTYAAAPSGGASMALPVLANGSYGYTTGTTVVNTSSTPVNATAQFYYTDGTVQGGSQTLSIGSNASQSLYQSLPSGGYGTAMITTQDGSARLVSTTNAVSTNFFYTYTEPNG